MDDNPLVSSTACLILHFRRPGTKRRLEPDKFSVDADKGLIGATKTILECPEYLAIARHETAVKATLRSMALPSRLYRDSTYLIPLANLKKADRYLEAQVVEHQELIDTLVTVYPARFEETKARLKGVGSDADRMGEAALRKAFSFEYEYVALSTPSTLRQVSAEMFEREQERLRGRLQSAEADIIEAFREKFAVLVGAMKDMLTGTDKGGKARRFAGWRIEKLQQFITDYTSKDVFGNEELRKLMGDANRLLAGVDSKELKGDETWRKSMSESFGEIAQALDAMTKVRGKRLIEDEEDDGEPAAASA